MSWISGEKRECEKVCVCAQVVHLMVCLLQLCSCVNVCMWNILITIVVAVVIVVIIIACTTE